MLIGWWITRLYLIARRIRVWLVIPVAFLMRSWRRSGRSSIAMCGDWEFQTEGRCRSAGGCRCTRGWVVVIGLRREVEERVVLVSAEVATSRCRRRGHMMSRTCAPSRGVVVLVAGEITMETDVGELLLAVCLTDWETHQPVCRWGVSLAG
jgi:hypothetical protein